MSSDTVPVHDPAPVPGSFRAGIVQSVPVPTIEALLALKYLSAVSPGRPPPDKYQDIADFIRGYKENVDRIDRGFLVDLASRAHSKAHQEFPEFLDAVENDRPVML